MQTELPHRYRQDQFRRYETYINHAVEAHPQAVKCDPKLFNIKQITFVARLRDAMRSLWDNQWNTTINNTKFREIYESIQVTERTDGTILIGTKEAIKGWIQQDKIPELTAADSNEILTLKDPQTKELIMWLSHKRLLAPRLKVIGLTDDEVVEFQNNFDVSIDKNPDGSWLLL